MSDPWKDTVDRIYSNPAFSSEALFIPIDGSGARKVKVLVDLSDKTEPVFGGGFISGYSDGMEVRKSEVALPAVGDIFEVKGLRLQVKSRPTSPDDPDRLVWQIPYQVVA